MTYQPGAMRRRRLPRRPAMTCTALAVAGVAAAVVAGMTGHQGAARAQHPARLTAAQRTAATAEPPYYLSLVNRARHGAEVRRTATGALVAIVPAPAGTRLVAVAAAG